MHSPVAVAHCGSNRYRQAVIGSIWAYLGPIWQIRVSLDSTGPNMIISKLWLTLLVKIFSAYITTIIRANLSDTCAMYDMKKYESLGKIDELYFIYIFDQRLKMARLLSMLIYDEQMEFQRKEKFTKIEGSNKQSLGVDIQKFHFTEFFLRCNVGRIDTTTRIVKILDACSIQIKVKQTIRIFKIHFFLDEGFYPSYIIIITLEKKLAIFHLGKNKLTTEGG
ncbi:hypothetical protein ACJX0J_013942 [Zea mays]